MLILLFSFVLTVISSVWIASDSLFVSDVVSKAACFTSLLLRDVTECVPHSVRYTVVTAHECWMFKCQRTQDLKKNAI